MLSQLCRGVASYDNWEGWLIFIYSRSQTVKTINFRKEINIAEECMNIPSHNYQAGYTSAAFYIYPNPSTSLNLYYFSFLQRC